MRVLSVAYPFAAVGRDAVGGAEQVLTAIDRALMARGHASTVIACAGSRVAGRHVAIAACDGEIDDAARRRTHAAVAAMARRAMGDADLVHMHGIDFSAYLPPAGPPVLATLHLPPDWYDPAVFHPARDGTWLHCVSAAQHRACPASPALLPPIGNGVPVADFGLARHARRRFALMLGRICPEKGQHLALDAARRADVPLLLAGEAFAYHAHRDYLERRVRPRLDARRRWLGPVGFARKRRLLAAARCLLVPSCAAETSSLVAMEAAACGTPVIAFRAGALPDIVRDGVTGFIVDDADGMADAIGSEHGTSTPEACRGARRGAFRRDADGGGLFRDLPAAAVVTTPGRRSAARRSAAAALAGEWAALWTADARLAVPASGMAAAVVGAVSAPARRAWRCCAAATEGCSGCCRCTSLVAERKVLPMGAGLSDYHDALLDPDAPTDAARRAAARGAGADAICRAI